MARLDQVMKQGLEQAWGTLSEGWRELGQRATGALTRFRHAPSAGPEAAQAGGEPPAASDDALPVLGGWAFLAADVFEDDDKLIVRLEAPGMRREDFQVELDDAVLSVRGEKRFERETGKGRYRVVQCAYGSFHREVALPVSVQGEGTRAVYRDGVLRIELPKAEGARSRRIDVA